MPAPNLNRISNISRLKGLSQAAPIFKAVSFKIYAALQNPTGLKSIYERVAENLLTDQMFYRERSSQGIFCKAQRSKVCQGRVFANQSLFLAGTNVKSPPKQIFFKLKPVFAGTNVKSP